MFLLCLLFASVALPSLCQTDHSTVCISYVYNSTSRPELYCPEFAICCKTRCLGGSKSTCQTAGQAFQKEKTICECAQEESSDIKTPTQPPTVICINQVYNSASYCTDFSLCCKQKCNGTYVSTCDTTADRFNKQKTVCSCTDQVETSKSTCAGASYRYTAGTLLALALFAVFKNLL